MSENNIIRNEKSGQELSLQISDTEYRNAFFNRPAFVAKLVGSVTDLQWIYDEAVTLFNIDPISGLKLMFHIYFEGTNGEGMYHIFDSIGLYMQNEMSPEVCHYIKRYWTDRSESLSSDDKLWWMRECKSWNCELTA